MHTTQNELDFLERLKGNVKALRGYLAGCEKRLKWDAINRQLVTSYAARLLLAVEGGAT